MSIGQGKYDGMPFPVNEWTYSQISFLSDTVWAMKTHIIMDMRDRVEILPVSSI